IDTTTAVSSSANPSKFGQSVTFTANVSASSGTPTGSVQFKIDGSNFGSPVSLSGGSAQISTSTLSVGNHTASADYGGSGNFNSSSGSLNTGQTVNKANTSTSLISSVNPSAFGQSVTFTASVSATAPGAGTPSGTVTFKDGATTLGTGTLNGSGQATFS